MGFTFLNEEKGKGYCKPPDGFLPSFFVKLCQGSRPLWARRPLDPLLLWVRVLPPIRGFQRICPLLSARVLLQHGLAVCQVADEPVPQSYQGLCVSGVCDDLVAWLNLPAPAAQPNPSAGYKKPHKSASVGSSSGSSGISSGKAGSKKPIPKPAPKPDP